MKPTARQKSESMSVAVLLTLSGGFMDAYSYLCRGQVFANAQTGNMVLFGVNAATGNFAAALRYLVPVLAFALGVVSADILRHCLRGKRLHWRQATVLLEIAVLCGVAFLPQGLNLLANSLTSLACGAQVESFRKVRGVSFATTMCIGNLRSAMQAFCDYALTHEKPAKSEGCIYACVILVFIAGAVLGNFCIGLWRERAILGSAALLFLGFACMFPAGRA